MKIDHEEQAWTLEGLRIILRRLEYHAQESAAIGCDSSNILRSGEKLRKCRRLIDSFENLSFTED